MPTSTAKRAGTLDASLVGWIKNTAKYHHWRVARYVDLEDLIQDGYLYYAKCLKLYGFTAKNQEHFMALFQRAYLNHITELARKRTRGEYVLIDDNRPDSFNSELWLDMILGGVEGEGFITRLKQEAKFPVSAVIALFTTESGVAISRRHPQRQWEPLNQYLCRLIGVDHNDYNLPLLVKSFLDGRGAYFLHQPV